MPELEIRHLRVLCAIADTGSLSQAAVRMSLTQPALSTQLQRIERMAGAEIFERSRAGVRPTAYGRMIIGTARGVLAGMDHLQSMTRYPTRSEADEVLRVGSVKGRMAGAWIRVLQEQLPGVEVHTQIGHLAPTLVQMLGNGQLDAVAVHEYDGFELNWPAAVCHQVLQPSEPCVIGVSTANPLVDRPVLTLAELADEEWILWPPDETGQHAAFLAACQDAGFVPRVRHYTSDRLAAQHFVQSGHGLMPLWATSQESPGLAIRMLAGGVMASRRFVAWRENLPPRRVRELWSCAVTAYLEQVNNNPAYGRWWLQHPEVHPALP